MFERSRRAVAARSTAYLDAALDCVILADSAGRVVEFNPAAERTFGYTREEALGRTLAELIVPPSLRDSHSRAFARFVDTRSGRLFGRRVELTGMRADGSEFPVELSLSRVEGEPLLICGALRDISGPKRAADELRLLVEEQEALRRVAMLLATEPKPSEVFSAITAEAAKVLSSPLVSMVRYEPDGTATVVASLDDVNFPVGSNWTTDAATILASVSATGRPARVDDYARIPGLIAERVRDAGINSAVGAPVTVDSKTWGAMIAVAEGTEPLPLDTESRLGRFTELAAMAIANTEARDEAKRLTDEQAALRRVATLVAHGATPPEVFAAVAKEVAELFGLPVISMVRFEAGDGSTVQVGAWGRENPHPVGTRMGPHPGVIQLVWETGRPARIEAYSELTGSVVAELLASGLRSALGAPIVVDGRLWGGVAAASTSTGTLPERSEERLASFTELVATAISNAQAHDDLRSSRARIVAAADDARRKIERDLHDGTQQQLVSVGLELQTLRASIPSELRYAHQELEQIEKTLDRAIESVREISQGVHPAILSRHGLAAALRALARRSAIPIELDVSVPERLRDSIEIGAYYIISEALANVGKHAQASVATVAVGVSERFLHARVQDNGVGGADVRGGSGLVGLIDRVDALGGTFLLRSPSGEGTTLSFELPLDVPPLAAESVRES